MSQKNVSKNVQFRFQKRKLSFNAFANNFIHLPQHELDLWPGFITSILQYEKFLRGGVSVFTSPSI